MESARDIELSAFILAPGRVLDALESACRRGAHVSVCVDGDPSAGSNGVLAKVNAASVARLARLGADAVLVHKSDEAGPALHLKAAIVDSTLYLDDRNWPSSGDDTIVCDTEPADVQAIRDALDGKPVAPPEDFSITKADALYVECGVIARAEPGDSVSVETETFGKGSGVYGELRALAHEGVHCRLLVSQAQERVDPREQAALRELAGYGVAVRIGRFEEKFAVAGTHAWLGSANATTPYYDGSQLEWGLRTDSSEIVNVLERRFNGAWEHSKPFA
jgi:hypothetical protein